MKFSERTEKIGRIINLELEAERLQREIARLEAEEAAEKAEGERLQAIKAAQETERELEAGQMEEQPPEAPANPYDDFFNQIFSI